ncbi:MAG: RrF2 family transcriptional regulator [Planctomycetota bacterium]|jgi:Rrf2 family protein
MNRILKFTEAGSLAMHTMCLLASGKNGLHSNREIAYRLHVSQAHLSKVLQRLGKAGLVTSARGPRGGFRLAKPPEDVTLLEVYESIEGPIATGGCLMENEVCDGRCILGGLLENFDHAIRDYLSGTHLSELAHIFRRTEDEKVETDHRD